MRHQFDPAPSFGVIPIEQIEINPKSRHDMARVLRSLQQIWKSKLHLEQILTILRQKIGKTTRQREGRPGMHYWRILVLALVKQALNTDYDHLVDEANEHRRLRQMLQHDDSEFGDGYVYELQTVIDNVSLITEEIWAELNPIIVEVGMQALGEDPNAPMEARCDSYVVETNVQFPTEHVT